MFSIFRKIYRNRGRSSGHLLLGVLVAVALTACGTLETGGTNTVAAFATGAGVVASVTGSAHVDIPEFPPSTPTGLATRNLTFTGIVNADGSVWGEWQLVAGATILHGSVDCLFIASGGDEARMSGVIEQAKFSTFQVGTAFALQLVDNGQGASGDPDETSALRAFRNLPVETGREFCETGAAPADLGLAETLHGNFQIYVQD